MKGIIYILQNPAMQGFVKIGVTTNLEQRLSSLYTTSVPLPFHVLHQRTVLDSYSIETEIFYQLAYCRCNNSREFFLIEPNDALKVIDKVCEQIEGAYIDDELDKYYNVWTCPD